MYRTITNELINRRNKYISYDDTIAWDVLTTSNNESYALSCQGYGSVAWGDGDTESINNGNFLSKSHTYIMPGLYTVSFSGDITRVQAGSTTTDRGKVRTIHSLSLSGYVGNSGNNLTGEFAGCVNATLNPQFKFASSLERLYGTFRDCKSITVLPLIPSDFTGQMLQAFFGCEIATLPPGFKIPAGVKYLRGAFQWCFNLGDISNVWPVGGFTKYGVDVSEFFAMNKSGASNNISGTVPGNLLWERASSRFSDTTGAFTRCTGLTNYSSIPASWGGGGA